MKSSKPGGTSRDGNYEDEARNGTTRKLSLPIGAKARLAADDAEIEALEKRLGVRDRTKLPKSFEEDGLGDLLEGLNDESSSLAPASTKRKRTEEEEWLRKKRRKAENDTGPFIYKDSEGFEDEASDLSMLSDDESQSNQGSDDSDGDDEESTFRSIRNAPKVRENPYVAPISSISTTSEKYIPPSRRIVNEADAQATRQLRRQMQGLLNRLSEANLLSNVATIEKIYQSSPRQHVSSALIELLMERLCDSTSLQDTFMILHSGFIAAMYKLIGIDFGAQIVQRIVEDYDSIRAETVNAGDSSGKLVNLISLLASLYNFHLIGEGLMYDFIRLFLADLTELNTELLLKVIRSTNRLDQSMLLTDAGQIRDRNYDKTIHRP